MTVRKPRGPLPWLATRLRFLADRIDHAGAPKRTYISFEFVRGVGIVTNERGFGCPLWFYGDEDYARAYERGLA